MLPIVLALMAAAPPAAAASQTDGRPQAAVQQLLQNCDAHKFETVIDVPVAGGGFKQSHVKLCGTEGQSDADWVRTLKDAVAKTQANEKMPQSVRDQIVSAINVEIGRLGGTTATKTASLPPPRAPAKKAGFDGYNVLQPLESAPPPPVHVLAEGSVNLPALPKPRMSFLCETPGEGAGGPCTDFTRDTLLTVRADEDLPPGTSIRFVRNGEQPTDVKLAELKKGKAMRLSLPADVCRGMTNGRLEIRIVRSVPADGASGEEVGQEGPYALRC